MYEQYLYYPQPQQPQQHYFQQLYDPKPDLIRLAIRRQRMALASLGITSALTLGIPTFFNQIPKLVDFFLLSTSVVSATGFTVLAHQQLRAEHRHATIQKADELALAQILAHEDAFKSATRRIEAENKLARWIALNLPEYQHDYWYQQYQLQGIMPMQATYQTLEVSAQPTHYLQSFNEVTDWHEDQSRPADAGDLYATTRKKHVIFTGNTGEGKTVAAHFSLYQWAIADPNLVIYAFDPHLGMGRSAEYCSSWLGIPKMTEIPKAVQSGVLKGEAAQLYKFLVRVQQLIKYRKEHGINSPDVVVLVEEFTNLLGELSEQEAEEIVKIFGVIGTEAQKYGVFIWLIVHTLTKDEMGLDRKFIRQCHIIMGVEMSQDRVQVSNSPRTIAASSLETGQEIYRERGLPAGFVTSLPVQSGYLPPPPVDDLRALELHWVPGSNWTDNLVPAENSAAVSSPTSSVLRQEQRQEDELEDFWADENTSQSINPASNPVKPVRGDVDYAGIRELVGGNPYKALKIWIDTNTQMGNPLSRQEISQAWEGFTGVKINLEMTDYLIRNLSILAA